MTMGALIQRQRESRTQTRAQMASRRKAKQKRMDLGRMLEEIQEKTLETAPSLRKQRLGSQKRLLIRLLRK